jgi:anti-sigma factor RsiW
MCPDRELLSAYVDGEVPQPWRGRIAEHLASCPSCSKAAEGYASLGSRLRAAADPNEAALLERLGRNLETRLSAFDAMAQSRHRNLDHRPGWRRSVSLPLPLAVAAGLTVALLVGLAASVALRPAREPVQSLAAEISPTPAQSTNMEALLQYLDSKDAQVTLTIHLPSGRTLDSSGSPVIMRAPRATTVAAPPSQGAERGEAP